MQFVDYLADHASTGNADGGTGDGEVPGRSDLQAGKSGPGLMRRLRIGSWPIVLGIAVLVAGGMAATLLLTRQARYAACPDAIPWDIARDRPGDVLVIRGEVVRGSIDEESGTVVLDLGGDAPEPGELSVVVADPSEAGFPGDLASRYVDRVVCVRGVIAEFEGAAIVVPSDPSDIWVE